MRLPRPRHHNGNDRLRRRLRPCGASNTCATSPTARTTSSASTTCATTWRGARKDLVQRDHFFVIVDEVDSILIDEARTPLIISGPSSGEANRWFTEFAKIARTLEPGEDYEVDEKKRTVGVLEPGIDKVEDYLGIDNLYEIRVETITPRGQKRLDPHRTTQAESVWDAESFPDAWRAVRQYRRKRACTVTNRL